MFAFALVDAALKLIFIARNIICNEHFYEVEAIILISYFQFHADSCNNLDALELERIGNIK